MNEDKLTRDEVFASNAKRTSDFVFDSEVAEVFDDMLVRSIPLYLEQQKLIRDIARRFWLPATSVADLGCSLGTTLLGIASVIEEAESLVGYDNSEAMLVRARSNVDKAAEAERVELRFGDLNGDLDEICLLYTSPSPRDS